MEAATKNTYHPPLRPLIHWTHHSSGRRAAAAKAIYLGRKAGLTQLTEELIQAASSNQYWPHRIAEESDEAALSVQAADRHRWPGGGWQDHPKLRRWVEEALTAKAGLGTEEEAQPGWTASLGRAGAL